MEKEIVCYCSNVSKETILDAIKNGAKNLQDIRDMTSACTIGKCQEFNPKKRCCSQYINKILERNVI